MVQGLDLEFLETENYSTSAGFPDMEAQIDAASLRPWRGRQVALANLHFADGRELPLDSRRALASQGKSQHTQQAALEKLRSELASLRDRVKTLTELRARDVRAFNDWAATWKRINPLEEDVGALASRVSALENVSHRHIGQTVKEHA